MAFDPSTAQLDSTFDPDTATESPDPGFKAGDYLKGLKRGVLAVPGALTGLADIPIALATGERVAGPVADALGRVTGFQPSKWAKETGETFSPGAKAAQAKIEEAWKGSGADRLGNALLGNFDDLPAAWKDADLAGAGRAIVENPGASALQVVESLPAMLAGGAIGKGVAVASKLAPAIAGAIGEGAITAGQQMDQTDAAVDPRRAAATSATAGALTGAIAGGMGRVAQKLGLEDIQTTMAGGKADATGLGRAGRLAGGAASEALQEIPQSAQEQVWQNVAEEKPLGEGVVRSAVEGGIAGGVMGAGANLRRPGTPLPPPGATAPGDIAEMDTLNAGLAQAGNDYAGQLPPNAGLLEEKPLVVQNPTTGVVTEIDRRGGPLEQAAAIAVESGAHEVAQNVDASEILFPYANARAAQDYIGRQADPEMYDAVPHPRVEGRTAVVPKTGPARQAILDKRAAGAANEQGKLRGEQLKQDESPAPTEITESIAGTFGNGSTGNVTITPQRGGGFEIRVSSTDGATKRSSVAGFPAGTNHAKAIAAATRSHGGFTKDKPLLHAKPVVDTTVADAAQDELAPPTVQPVTDMPGVQQRAKAQARGAVAKAQTRAAQLADEETVDTQAQAANPEPSEAQKAAGNYAHGHIRVGGLDISVETPAGATRTGMDKGKPWKVKNTAHYGYVKRSKGADGEQVDVYVKPGTSSTSEGPVFVVDQYNLATGAFDEHKALLGYSNQAEAAAAYDAHFNDKSGPKRRGAVTQMSLDAFKGWLASGDTSKAVSGKRFGKVVADNEQAAQDEIARSTGKMSLPRSAQKPGESNAAFELRRAAATQAAKTARVAGQQALPTKEGDKAGVREALGMPDDAEVSILSAESRPDAGKAKGVSKQAAQFIQQVARIFGKRVVFFDVPDRGAAEGFYVRGNTVYLNTNSSTQHLRILGHELTHAMKRQARGAYEKMLGAVAALRTDEEMAAQHADYFGRPLEDVAFLDQPHPGSDGTLREFLAEEWMADLGGNRFAEAEFWTSVFGRLEGQHGTEAAKGIVARLRLAMVAALNKLKTLIGGNAFAVDARLGEHLEGIRTAVAEGFAEYARLSKARQLADVAGEAKFKQPGSDIGHKRESDGRYVGAPEWVGTSPQQLAVLRKKLLQITLEGEPGRFWYEQSSKAILDLAKGDKDEAEKIVQLIALYSPSTQVPGNTTQALKAYYQWKQGQPVRVGFGQADRKANALLYEGKEWKGMKTNTFYSNLMEEIDPSKNLDGATMDMWTAIAFDYGSKVLDQGPKYKFAERETQRIAKRLGWSPHQVQAAIWTAMKGRVDPIRGVLTAQELDNGWYDEESQAWWASGEKAKYESRRDAALRDRAAGKRTPFARVDVDTEKLQPARRKDHYHLAHKLGMEYNLTPEDVAASKYDFSNAINERMAQMSWEATPGETTGVLPGIHKAPMHQQQEYLVAIRKALSDEKGNDLIGKEVGLALAASVQGFSGWQGVSTVGIQDGIAVPIDTQTNTVQQVAVDAINLVADIKGLVLYQEGVAWHFPYYKGSKNGQNGVEFRIGRLLTEEENANLYKGLVAALGHTDAPPIPTQDGQGFRVLNFPDEKFALMDDFGKGPEEQKRKKDLQKAQLEKNVAFIETVKRVVYAQPWHAEVTDNARFESIGDLRQNDWSKGDGDYRGRIAEANSRWPTDANRWAGRSDIHGWIEHDLRPRVAEVNRDFSERYGWGKASLSPQRADDGAGRGYVGPEGGRTDSGSGGSVSGQGARQQGQVALTGVHFSKEPRSHLSGVYFGKGTGAKSQEAERIFAARDDRIKSRIYAYVNEGKGVFPEDDVGRHAHAVKFDKLYDAVADPLDLWATYRDANARESAMLDAGFDGYYARGAFGNQGVAILMGKAATQGASAEYKGTEYRGGELEVPPVGEPSTFGKQMRAVAANRGLPSGEMTGADWKRLMPKLMPDIDVSHLNDEQKYYKDEVIKRPQALAKMSPQREGLPEGFRVEANPISEGRKFIVTDASGTRLGSGETREEAIARFKEAHAALYPAVPESPASPSTLDGTRLKTLRRAAAGLETPQRGVFLRVTDDGKAIASGPKGARIPDAFRRFAHDNGLSFYAERKGYAQASAKPLYAGGRTSGDGYRGIPYASIAGVSEPIPIAYRESGALYFGEMGAAGLDRTDKTRFSTQRLAQLDTTTTTDNGIRFETGKPVTFPYLHNKESATKLFGVPRKDAPFDRGFEPSGKYVTVSNTAYLAKDSPQKYEAGTLTFNNPLVLSVNGWKPALSKAFGNLTGKRLSQALISAGFDGVVTAHEKGGASEVLDLTSFDLKKAKYSPPRFFSQLARTFENAPAKLQAQPAAQWKLWLAGQQAVKKDEIAWSGINDWLDLQGKAKVSRAQIQEYLAHNGVQLGEKVLDSETDADSWDVLDEEGFIVRRGFDTRAEAAEYVESLDDGQDYFFEPNRVNLTESGPRFDQYVLPGGQNYRELLITLPPKQAAKPQTYQEWVAGGMVGEWSTKGVAAEKVKFKSDHFDEPNILAHVRFNERVDTDGHKVLFLEELQSDWGQQGKRKGFVRPPMTYYLVGPSGQRMKEYPTAEEAKAAAEEISDIFPETTYTWEHGTPHRPYVEPGPFVTDTKAWTALALKRAVLWAVQNGFSKVAWTTGEQQAERYDLSKHVGYITLDRGYPEGYSVTAYRNDDATDEILQKDVKTPEDLADVIGKDAANKLLQDMGPGTHGELARPDIKVGGGGMSAYYDSIVPQVANDLLRKVGGGKVETVEVAKNGREGKSVRQIDRPGMKTRGDLFEQPGFTITPVMTAKVTGEGLPLFSPVRANLGALSPAQAAAANNVLGTPKTFMERLAEFKKDWAKNLKQGIFDQFAPIAELDQQAYIQARLSKGGESTLEALMLYGKLFVGADGATDVRYTRAAGKQGFAGKMAALKGEHDRFLLWVAAQRADRLQAIGLENLWTPNDIVTLKGLDQGAMKDGTARPALYAQALQDLNAFNDNVLDVAVSSGLIDDATRQMYAGTPYVPFYRLQEDDTVTGFGIKPGLVNQYAWKKLKGGTQKLNEDLLANLLHNWSHLITASAKNRAAKATLDAAATAGIAAQVPAGMPGKGHVSYKAAGQEQVFVVSDPHLFDAVAALHYAGLGPWAKPLAAAKHWLTIGVTANPAFKVRNLIRDSIGALGAAQLSYNVAGNLQQGWQATAEDNETRAHLLASGGMIRFGSMLDGKDSQRAADLIHEGVDPAMILDSDAKIKKFWRRYVHPALSAYNELGDRTENLNRAALYEQLIAKGLTNAEAAYWSRDLMDFAMSGKWTAIRTLTQTVPFFNARLQGLYKLGRAGKQDIRRLGTVLGAVSLSSLALLLAYGDDDDWKKRSDSDRNNYWWFKVGGHAFRLPKPFEIGAVGTLAERGYELMFEKEMTDARFGRNMRDIVMSQLSMNPVPQLFKPMMDIYANKDAFTGQAIESMGMERLRKEDRYDERTSGVARFLGGLGLPDLTQLVMGRWDTLSPKQVDFLARGYFSWLGTMTTTALDYGIRPMLDRGAKPERQLKDVFFAGNFVETLPSNQSRYLTQLYDQAREIEQAYASYHHLLKLGDIEGAKEIREEEGDLIRRYPATQQLKRAESLMGQQLQRINASTTLSSEEKRVRLDQVYARRNALAERFQAQ